MHELSVTEGMLKIVLRHAERNGAQRVEGITVRIGELSDILEEWLQKYFDYLSRGTIAEGARIRVERSPALFRCQACQKEYVVDIKGKGRFSCPACGGSEVDLIAGREFEILELQVI